ncbi:MAG: DHH family phosphoesterase [Bacilli bacterium]
MFKKLRKFIERHDTITIFSHVYPDGDAIGSIIGLRELIKTSYKHKKVFGLGTNVQPFVSLFGALDIVSDEVIKDSGAIIVDVANGARVEDQRYKLAKASFKLDHHIFAEKFTDEELVLTTRIATAEIIGEFMMKERLRTNTLGATALALGIITDSGRFKYDLTSGNTFKVMARLTNIGADLKMINEILSKRSAEGFKKQGHFLSNYELYENVIYIVIPNDKLKELGILPSEGTDYVNIYSNLDDYPLWATFLIEEDGRVFVELRSKIYNVQKVATLFGGGGHLKASGCRLENKAQIADVLTALTKAEELKDEI